MTEPKMVTEQEARRREQRAFEKGSDWTWRQTSPGHNSETLVDPRPPSASAEAARRYPLPKVTRPRVAKDELGVEYQVMDNEVRYRWRPSFPWAPVGRPGLCGMGYPLPTPERIRLWADLLERPLEEVTE